MEKHNADSSIQGADFMFFLGMDGMWIIWYGLHSHQVWTQLNSYAEISDPNKGVSSGWMVFSQPEEICQGALKLFLHLIVHQHVT